jgi:carbon storage regulator CsrA
VLVLTRSPHQVLIIDADIQVIVLDITGDRVRFGITAPLDCKIRRQEMAPRAQTPAEMP